MIWRLWAPVVLYAALIFFLSSLPSFKTPSAINNADKLAHFMEYGIFGLLLFRAGRFTWVERGALLSVLFTILTGVAVAISDEIYQGRVGRTQSFHDFLADVAGLCAAAFGGWLLTRMRILRLRDEATP